MKVLKRILLTVLSIIVVTGLGVFLFLQNSKPVYDGELSLNGPIATIEVLFDDYGIPHIYAQNETDTYFALGYVHAQDRLFQMEMLRRAAAGRLSEIIGPDGLKIDKLFRTLRINEFAERQAAKFFSTDTAAFQKAAYAYQKGVNTFIRDGKTPLEFNIMGIPKTEFTPKDLYLAIGFMTLGFAEGLKIDPVLQQIKWEWGDEYLKDLAVDSPADAVRIPSYRGDVKTQEKLISSIRDALEELPVPLITGSNGWVISGDKTKSGKPILANDTHMEFGQPTVWYEAHIEYPGFSFYGHHLPGLPFGVLGQNNFCAWGITMFENDDTDFFMEATDEQHPGQVKRVDAWESANKIKEIIKIKGQPDFTFEVNTTSHGPIVNSIFESIGENENWIALDWQLLHGDNQDLRAIYELNHASSFAEANSAISLIPSPGLNIMYGDVAGNIAWWAAAKLPIRKNKSSKFFLDASTGLDDYDGYYDFAKNPQSVNPPNGIIYTANNQPDTVRGNYFPGYYYPRDRAGRIVKLLNEKTNWTIDEIKTVNLDIVSNQAVKVAKEMSIVLDKNPVPEFAVISSILNEWDGNHRAEDIGPSVYYNMLSQIIYLAMADEIGNEAVRSIASISIMKNSYLTFLSNDSSPWWDNINTPDVEETRSDIFLKAAEKSLSLLNHTSGKDPGGWTWNKIHTLKHKHPLGAIKLFDRFFSVGPLEVPGGNEVINNLHFNLDTIGYFPVTGGPALRKITDFSDLGAGETVSPTGQSGNVMSDYYSDQSDMFATGQFRRMLVRKEDIEMVVIGRLVIKPKQP